MSLALLTNKTFLLRRNENGVWEKFIDITKYPQVLGEAEIIDMTRIHDMVKRYITGAVDAQVLAFEANYTKENYAKANDPKVTDVVNDFRLCFGDESGVDGCWEWSGRVSPYVAEGQPNGIRKLIFIITDEGDTSISEAGSEGVGPLEPAANCDKPHVIKVTELPAESIGENAVYLLDGDYYTYKTLQFLDYYMFFPSYDLVMSFKEVATAEGMELYLHTTPTRTTEGILESSDTVVNLYWILDEGVVSTFADGEWSDMPVNGIVGDASEMVDDGYYIIGQDGGWTKYTTAPVGTLTITTNGTHDVAAYASAAVTVPNVIPEGYVKPTGTKTITENGTHDVSGYANAEVDIPDPVLQEKTVTENGEVTPDAGYDGLSKVTVAVKNSGGGNSAVMAAVKRLTITQATATMDGTTLTIGA